MGAKTNFSVVLPSKLTALNFFAVRLGLQNFSHFQFFFNHFGDKSGTNRDNGTDSLRGKWVSGTCPQAQ
jgi:hypothetical protein